MGINFTEAIRKSNIAKQKVIEANKKVVAANADVQRTKDIAEEIKKALEEKGVDTTDVNFEDLPKFIKDANIGGGTWERPKEWLDLPRVELEEDRYWKYLSEHRNDYEQTGPLSTENEVKATENIVKAKDMTEVEYFLADVSNIGNLSQVETGMTEDGVFKVSANDFAYVMLCEVRENMDNIIQMAGSAGARFVLSIDKLREFGEEFGLSDLYIQIDNEEPINLLELREGNITLPTEGKCKDIAVSAGGKAAVMPSADIQADNPANCNLYITVGLDYNEFSDDTKLKNGNKQCVVKIWGNGFLNLYPMHAFNATYPELWNTGFKPPIYTDTVRVNDCVLDVTMCDANILVTNVTDVWRNEDTSFPYEVLLEQSYNFTVFGFGECVEKVTLMSSLPPEALIYDNAMPYYGQEDSSFTSRGKVLQIMRHVGNFNCYFGNIREIDCTNLDYYNNYYSMASFLNTLPFQYISNAPKLNIKDSSLVTAKGAITEDGRHGKLVGNTIPLDKIVFPDFKKDIANNSFHFMYINGGESPSPLPLPLVPFTLNLSTFTRLTRDCILDLIDKLPTVNLTVGEVLDTYFSSFEEVSTEESGFKVKDISKTIKEIILNLISDNYKGNIEENSVIHKFVFKYSLNDTLTYMINWDAGETETLEDLYRIAEQYKQFVIVSTYTYKQLTREDLQLAESKGWQIVADINFIDIGKFVIDNNEAS